MPIARLKKAEAKKLKPVSVAFYHLLFSFILTNSIQLYKKRPMRYSTDGDENEAKILCSK
ncbi:hypothetical protein CSE16_11335 [Solibacillus sp. R5-41]|nr:hypothetical protein CSE16_11335 [Solibacillus sp. R5-41]